MAGSTYINRPSSALNWLPPTPQTILLVVEWHQPKQTKTEQLFVAKGEDQRQRGWHRKHVGTLRLSSSCKSWKLIRTGIAAKSKPQKTLDLRRWHEILINCYINSKLKCSRFLGSRSKISWIWRVTADLTLSRRMFNVSGEKWNNFSFYIFFRKFTAHKA